MPVADPSGGTRERQLLTGDVPSPANPPSACRFHTRCPKAQPLCSDEEPLLERKSGGGVAACHYPLTDEEIAIRLPTALTRQRDAAKAAAAQAAGSSSSSSSSSSPPSSSSSST